MQVPRALASLLLLIVFSGCAAAAEPAPTDEVRVLIDVSGSMKRNDPQNLRAPALRLLVNLLPADSRAGVWSFAQQVARLTPVQAADQAWRDKALAASGKIHSRGLFTDIGTALETASADWLEPDPSTRRSLILLTDGMVDVSKQPGVNEQARADVLNQTLARLRAGGIAVHAIALSADADRELLQALADQTDGSFEQTDDAEQLQRLFLRLFERSVQRDTLPLEDNRFSVDASISELTLLAFRKAGTEPARLVTPSGRTLIKDELPEGIRWHHETGYDLITISQPEPGEWRLLAEVDPDNRVMIVTDLKLATSELPNNLIAGETLPLLIKLTEQGETITRAEFLAFTRVQVEQQQADAAPRVWMLADDGKQDDQAGGDGVFSLHLGASLLPGEHALAVVVDGKTFRREQRRSLKVSGDPLKVDARPLPEGQPFGYEIALTPALDWIDPASLKIAARLSGPDGHAEQLAVPATEGGWLLRLDTLDPALDHRLDLQVSGKTVTQRAFHVKLPALELAAAPPAAEPQPEPTNWLLVVAVVVLANLALIALIALVYYLLRQRRRGPPRFDDLPESAGDAAKASDGPATAATP